MGKPVFWSIHGATRSATHESGSGLQVARTYGRTQQVERLRDNRYKNCVLEKCVNSSNMMSGYCAPWWLYLSFSCSRWLIFILEPLGKIHSNSDSFGRARRCKLISFEVSQRPPGLRIWGVVRRKIIDENCELLACRVASNNIPKVLPTPAEAPEMRMSAELDKTFS